MQSLLIRFHPCVLRKGGDPTRRAAKPPVSRRRQRQSHLQLAAVTRSVAARLHPAAVQLHQTAHQGKADTEARSRAVERLLALSEEVEDARQQIRPNADAFVADADHRLAEAATRG